MIRLAVLLAINVAALLAADHLVEGIEIATFAAAVVAGAVFGVVNWLVKPVVKVLALPVIVLTLGVALFFVNLAMLALTAWLSPDFAIDGLWPAVLGTVVVWAVNAVLQSAFGVDARLRRG